jgi:hypothetical protein
MLSLVQLLSAFQFLISASALCAIGIDKEEFSVLKRGTTLGVNTL